MKKIIDLSMCIKPNLSEPDSPQIDYVKHSEGAKKFCQAANNQLNPQDFPDQCFLSNEFLTLSVHTGTHLDAPWHFGPVCNGRQAKSIDEIPLDWCIGPGVLLDVSQMGICEEITGEDICRALANIRYALKANDIVLIKTGAEKLWGRKEYFTDYIAMGKEATNYVLDCGVRVIGIDAYGFDIPFHKMIARYQQDGDQSHLWPCHFLGRSREYLHIERLANLDALPAPLNFIVICFPIKIDSAGAGWTRVAAIYNTGKI